MTGQLKLYSVSFVKLFQEHDKLESRDMTKLKLLSFVKPQHNFLSQFKLFKIPK